MCKIEKKEKMELLNKSFILLLFDGLCFLALDTFHYINEKKNIVSFFFF